MKKRQIGITLAAASLLLTSLAGCGDSKSSDSDTIAIGLMTSVSGPQATAGKVITAGVEAAIQAANDNGGINGHRVRAAVADDQASPANAPAAARQLVEQDKVVAMNTSFTSSAAATLPYLKKHAVLDVPTGASSALIEDPESTYRLYLPDYVTEARAMAKYAVETLHKKRIAVAYTPDDTGEPVYEGVKAELKKLGMPMVAAVKYQADAPAATTQAAQLKAAKPDFVIVNHVPTVISVLFKAAKQVGLETQWGALHPGMDSTLLDLMGSWLDDKIYFVTPFISPTSPEAAEYQKYMGKLGADPNNMYSFNAFCDTKVLLAVIQQASDANDGKAPTSAQVLDATKDFKMDGTYVQGLHWTETSFTGMTKLRVATVKGGTFAEARGFESVEAN